MGLSYYNLSSFNAATRNYNTGTFLTDGVNATYIDNSGKTNSTEIGSTIQYSNIQKNQYNGGFTDNNGNPPSVTINVVPPANLQGVLPSSQGQIICNAYDHFAPNIPVTPATPGPQINVTPFWLANIDDPHLYMYLPPLGATGISLTLVNNITSVTTPDITWVQLACSDANGNALTFVATGQPLYTDQMASFSTVAASAPQSTNMLTVVSATGTYYFIPGDYVITNIGNSTQEVTRIASISYNTLTMSSSFNYSHYVGETVYFYGREFFVKETVPTNATNNVALNGYNLTIDLNADRIQRP